MSMTLDSLHFPRVSMEPSSVLERAVERATGENVDVLRARPISDTRRIAEQRRGRPFQIISRFPFIGRGNVMRDRILSHERVEAELDRALRN